MRIREIELDKLRWDVDGHSWWHLHTQDNYGPQEMLEYAAELEAENAELREVVLARGEKLGYADEDLRGRGGCDETER